MDLQSYIRRIGHSSTVFTIFVVVAFFLLSSLPFLYVSPCNLGNLYGVGSNNRSILGLKSNPFNSRVKDTVFALKEQLTQTSKQGAWIAAKSIPESMQCLSMRLMEERIAHSEKYIDDGNPTPSEFEDPKLYHYAIFSDNVLAVAASVVVNSAVKNSKDPSQHVFHVVTNKVNFWAMQVMFKMKDYSGAHIEVKVVEDYKFFNSSYGPVNKQLESAEMHATKDNMKFRNPTYLSIMNHLMFYLPEMYPKLHRILFLDDDVVVQRDLTGLWKIDMDGKFNPKACAWAFGMNFFDLDAWTREKSTEEYHYWQNMNENLTLWRLGTWPPGLITFYSTTKVLDKSWHVLDPHFNPSVNMYDIDNVAVVHFNGNMQLTNFGLFGRSMLIKKMSMCRHVILILVMVEHMLDGVNKLVLRASPVWLDTSPSHVKLVLNFKFTITSTLVLGFFFFYFNSVFLVFNCS